MTTPTNPQSSPEGQKPQEWMVRFAHELYPQVAHSPDYLEPHRTACVKLLMQYAPSPSVVKEGGPVEPVDFGIRSNGTAWISIGTPNKGRHAACDIDLPPWALASIKERCNAAAPYHLGEGNKMIAAPATAPGGEALQDVIRWALGEIGDFPDWPESVTIKGNPKYWWRKELRARYEAALSAPPPPRAEDDTKRIDQLEELWRSQGGGGHHICGKFIRYAGNRTLRDSLDAARTPPKEERKT